MKVALYSRNIASDFFEDIKYLVDQLQANNLEPVFFQDLFNQIYSSIALEGNYTTFDENTGLDESVECVISIGGDGTLLDTVTLIKTNNIPVIGINYGRLGFLACLHKDDVNALIKAIVEQSYTIQERSLIHVDSNIPIFGKIPYGLNEFSIHKKDNSSMIKINTFINGEFLNNYWADGLIISTPTGSTGYSLSCGGPVVFPESNSFIITPVASHNLNTRPIIVSDNNIISFEIEARADGILLAMDSRREIVPKEIQLAVRRETFNFKLMQIQDNTFLQTLRKKLYWGLDQRNTNGN